MSVTHTRNRSAARGPEAIDVGFVATPSLSSNLQLVLADLVELHLQGKQAHWNIVGSNFRDLHLLLDEIVSSARDASDTIAERMRALHAIPDGRSETVTATTSLPSLPSGEINTREAVELMAARLTAVATRARSVHDAVDEQDPTSADLLHEVIETSEKFAWLMGAENWG
ncbi:MAG: starvation-inducible DNA-binding protein [Pseudonocardiales bacterium]|jgi:starvation-inducible DNA-binding protein|nr:starvation-inducible DNA-binding protein [Pseudonocardiales bacterium]MDT7608354.1 starvation-inducible DNA-binding protein [Pseudonocardiales bacterium]MDT7620491.1 starvation-inducible DNA-binding protein [Pseudonocardiales bacterium]MDT7773870.1 starvation-inducible DNA-binding protein [Pseudonocardiales bacterium]